VLKQISLSTFLTASGSDADQIYVSSASKMLALFYDEGEEGFTLIEISSVFAGNSEVTFSDFTGPLTSTTIALEAST